MTLDRRRLLVTALTTGLSGAASTVGAAPGDIHNLGTLGGSISHGFGINASGEVAGWSRLEGGVLERAFRYTGAPGSGGVMEELGTLGGAMSYGFAINDAGHVVGRALTSTNASHAFLYAAAPGPAGSMLDLGTLGGENSIARGINVAGQVTGQSQLLGSPAAGHAFLYSGVPGAGGVMRDLGTLGGAISEGRAINDAGQVTGSSYMPGGSAEHAFLYTGLPGAGGAMADLGTLGGTNSHGHGINNAGQVVGRSNTSGAATSTMHAFRYTGVPGGGVMEDLGTLGGPYSEANDINDAGFAIGNAERFAGSGNFLTLWPPTTGSSPIDLDAWLDEVNPGAGAHWTLLVGFSINNSGLVTGIGRFEDGPGGPTDGERAFILDASSLVPEPAGFALLATAAGCLMRGHRTRQTRGRSR